ncbi:PAS domain S-box protein [Desulfobacula sp.]
MPEIKYQYRSIVEDMPIMICSFLPDGKITYVNKTYCEHFNKTREELIGSSFLSVIPETKQKIMMDIISTLTAASPIQSHENPVIDSNGVTRWQRWANCAVFDDLGKLIAYQSIGEDVTAYKRKQKAILKKNRALKLYSECNKLIVHGRNESDILNKICRVIVEQGNYRFAWIGFAGKDKAKTVHVKARYGFEEGYLDDLNITWADTQFGQSPTGTAIRLNKPVISKQISSDSAFGPWKEKAQKHGYLSNIALPLNFEHQVFGALSIYASEEDAFSADETRLLEELTNDLAHGIMAIRSQKNVRQAQKIIKTERDKLQKVVNSIGESMYIVNKDFIIEFQNNIFKEQFGEFVGQICYKSMFQRNEPCTFCLMLESINENRMKQLETDFLNKNHYDIIFSPFQESDTEIKSVVVMRDITEKKNLQAEAIRVGHLASLGELAAGVAHEINNPITGIISIAEILTERFHELGGDKRIPERIINEGERIGKIVKNLLSFARDKKEEYCPTNVNDILELTLELVEKQIARDGILLLINIPSDIPEINARSQEIQQVFLNIVSNARYALQKKYPKPNENKILEIKGEKIKIDGKRHVRITFYDRGLGISKDFLDRVANPFFSTKPPGEGTGLGLSISHGIIKNHGGNLWFESRKGEYTKAVVDLPANNKQSSQVDI